MKTTLKTILVAGALAVAALPSFAHDAASASADKLYRLKDGGTLYVFKDGKMALEDKFGRATYLKIGQILESIDGQKITASSNEVARLDSLIVQGHQGS
jgi:hypothetical protein